MKEFGELNLPAWVLDERGNNYGEDLVWMSDEDEDDGNLRAARRQYKMATRINLDSWDDVDFIRRFRLSKQTVMEVLGIVEHELEHTA